MAKKKSENPVQFLGTGEATGKIIKCLQKASSASGQRPLVIFADWIEIVEATLQALPMCRFQSKCRKAKFSIVIVEKVSMQG